MIKEFLEYKVIRNNALKIAYKIHQDGFIRDVIYSSLRGGAYMANVISEYFKLVTKKENIHPVLYAGVVGRSYSDIQQHTNVCPGDKILLVDDIYDSGNTINCLVEELMNTKGMPRSDIKVVVHDYKYFTYYEKQLPIQPDYWCRKFEITKPEENRWIHYLSHELVGLTNEELEKYYYADDPELKNILGPYLGL